VVPGIIQSEHFDEGGKGVAYHDTSAGNTGGKFRTTDVDIESTTDVGGGFDIGWISAGEWWNYSIDVTAPGVYTIQARVAASGQGGTFHIEVNGSDVTGPMVIPNTGGWQTWTTIAKPGVPLAAGQQMLRVVVDGTGPTGIFGNLNYLRLASGAVAATAFGGTPVRVPGLIEAEHFDEGGEGIAYHDSKAGNTGGQLRSDDVDIERTVDTGGGYDVGWTTAGEWLVYSIDVAAPGTFAIDVRAASNGAGGTFHIEVNGTNVTGPMVIPNTGGWQNWTTITKTGVSLNGGPQSLRIVLDSNGPTGVFGNLNYVRVR
jgi:hypothetical protein